MRLRLVKGPFNDPDYIFELKHDGFRALAYIDERGECRLVSRNLKHLRFKTLEEALATLPVQNAIIDGEIICVDSKGVSHFNELLSRKAEPVLYAFDLLWLNGDDLRKQPLILRKDWLAALIRLSDCNRIMYAQHVEVKASGCSQRFADVIWKVSSRSERWAFTKTMAVHGSKLRTENTRRPRAGMSC